MNRTRQNISFLFDLDGVIIDSEKTYTLIWREINRIFPTGVPDMEYRIKGMTLHAILSTYFPDPDLQKKVVGILYEKEKQMKYHYTEGAAALLERLRHDGIPTALVTSSNDQKNGASVATASGTERLLRCDHRRIAGGQIQT